MHLAPIPLEQRRFSGLDQAVLWGDLSVGILVIVTGALLVPGLSLRQALLATAIGSAIGAAALAAVAVVGARDGVPTMVLLRPVLGTRGSYVPSILNLVQLVGWTALELWAMGRIANALSIRVLGLDAYPLWLAVVTAGCLALALGGPVVVVRAWLERFGVWVVAATGAWITFRAVSTGAFADAWSQPGVGGFASFWLAIDLAIALPVSWLPLVADYSRFAKPRAHTFAGTFAGTFVGNLWFFALGAVLVLTATASPGVLGIGDAIIATGGGLVALLVLMVTESDEAFANIYSSAVSVRNIRPSWSQRRLVVAAALVGAALALVVSMEAYESFLLWIGSVFVPLFGVFAAETFVLGGGRAGSRNVDLAAFVPWVAGIAVYHWGGPLVAFGASVPSFVVAFALALVLGWVRRSDPPRSGERSAEHPAVEAAP